MYLHFPSPVTVRTVFLLDQLNDDYALPLGLVIRLLWLDEGDLDGVATVVQTIKELGNTVLGGPVNSRT